MHWGPTVPLRYTGSRPTHSRRSNSPLWKTIPSPPSPSMLMAMRDPEIFADPEKFDITRKDHPRYSAAFGGGVHRCLGEALARIELEEAIAAFASHWPNARVTRMPSLRGLSGTRGIDEMRVSPKG